MSDEKLLEVKHLKKYFSTPSGKLHAVDDVSFDIYKGTTLGVVGESGCGKSTLGSTLLNLLSPTGGEVIFRGQDVAAMSKREFHKVRPKMQMLFQDPYSSLNGRMTVHQLIAEPLLVNKVCRNRKEVDERVSRMMDTVGLAKRLTNSYPHELDGGSPMSTGLFFVLRDRMRMTFLISLSRPMTGSSSLFFARWTRSVPYLLRAS